MTDSVLRPSADPRPLPTGYVKCRGACEEPCDTGIYETAVNELGMCESCMVKEIKQNRSDWLAMLKEIVQLSDDPEWAGPEACWDDGDLLEGFDPWSVVSGLRPIGEVPPEARYDIHTEAGIVSAATPELPRWIAVSENTAFNFPEELRSEQLLLILSDGRKRTGFVTTSNEWCTSDGCVLKQRPRYWQKFPDVPAAPLSTGKEE